MVPSIIVEMHQLADMVTRYATTETKIPFLPDSVHTFLKDNIDFNQVSALLAQQDWKAIASEILQFISSGLDIILAVISWLIVLLYVIFIMLDYDRLMIGFKQMVPPRYRPEVYKIGRDIKMSMNHYFRGQALVALIVGILFSIGFSIIGLPLAVVLGLFIGLLNMVPYLQLISIVPTTLLCLIYSVDNSVSFWSVFWSCMAVYIVVQAIQDLFLTPKIMGKAMGLNPAIILLSLSIWGTLLGLLGLIIALPLTTLLLSYYNYYVIDRAHETDKPTQDTEVDKLANSQ
jgi:predicted PurR-regulated permease PerM